MTLIISLLSSLVTMCFSLFTKIAEGPLCTLEPAKKYAESRLLRAQENYSHDVLTTYITAIPTVTAGFL